MPGITGFFERELSPRGGPRLEQMIACMRHESSYASGKCEIPELGVSAGWVARDGAVASAWNGDGTIGLLFSGDVFGDSTGPGVTGSQSGQDDLRSLISRYEKHGIGFLKDLNGWFAGVLVDHHARQVLLFNDRYGLGRVYFHEGNDGFYFSSEAKSLLAVLPALRELDRAGLADWFSCGCVLGNRTLFRGVSLMPPGSVWTFSPGVVVRKQTYFNPSAWESQPPLTDAEFSEQLQQTFPRVLKRYLNGTRPVAMSLTGGLDGRMIMAWARPKPGDLPCYTFNGTYRDCADARIGRRVAVACGQSHKTISVGDEFLAGFPKLAEQTVYISDGAMDVTGSVELYVNRLARQIAPVRLTGNYGSEILRRYVAFRPRAFPGDMLAPDVSRLLPAAAAGYAAAAAGNRLSFIAFKQVPWHHYSRLSVEQSQIALRSPFLDNDLVSLAFRAPETAVGLAPSLQLIARGNPELGRIPTDRGITYPAGGRANRLLYSIQEFLARAEYAYDYGMPDWLARTDRWLAPLRLERLFLGRQKFYHFRTWYRHQLGEFVRQVLLDPRSVSRFWVNRSTLEPRLRAHLNGTANCTLAIHKLLSLELLHRTLIEPA